MQSKVFVTRRIPKAALDLLHASRHHIEIWPHTEEPIPRDTLIEKVKGIDGLYCLITDRIDAAVLDAAGSNLKVVSTMSVGYDHIQVSEIQKRGIVLGNTPDVLTDATAELTVALLLATSRRLFEANQEAKNGGWGTWSPLWMCGIGLRNSIVGICGMGRIGVAVARRLLPFGVQKILYSGKSEKIEAAKEVGAQFVSLDQLLQESDFVLACCALNDQTRGMFNKTLFSKMKSSSIFINTSRGGVVNQDDLVEALQNGYIKAAGLDVTTPEPIPIDHPLLKMKNCVVLPHIGSAEDKTRIDMAVLAAKNLLAALDGQPIPSQVILNKISVL